MQHVSPSFICSKVAARIATKVVIEIAKEVLTVVSMRFMTDILSRSSPRPWWRPIASQKLVFGLLGNNLEVVVEMAKEVVKVVAPWGCAGGK